MGIGCDGVPRFGEQDFGSAFISDEVMPPHAGDKCFSVGAWDLAAVIGYFAGDPEVEAP
jgi:hypothetical protein